MFMFDLLLSVTMNVVRDKKKDSLPLHLVVLVTGKGPMRKAFLEVS